jgi:VIT1/CCC1 family predicted Fe2+/Mn2+ transporter
MKRQKQDSFHQERHFTASDLIKDIVIGMSDGLTVPFALAAGLSGAVSDNKIIITAGIAEVVAGSIAMGLGGYLAGKTETDHYRSELKREYLEVETVPDIEKQEVKEVFAQYGISPGLQESLVSELALNNHKWVKFMMRFELGMEEPDIHRAAQSARNIGLSYIIGGMVPLAGYFITASPRQGLIYSSIMTVLFLFGFGFIKTKLTGDSPFTGALKTVIIGVLAASAAFLIAKLIS